MPFNDQMPSIGPLGQTVGLMLFQLRWADVFAVRSGTLLQDAWEMDDKCWFADFEGCLSTLLEVCLGHVRFK